MLCRDIGSDIGKEKSKLDLKMKHKMQRVGEHFTSGGLSQEEPASVSSGRLKEPSSWSVSTASPPLAAQPTPTGRVSS